MPNTIAHDDSIIERFVGSALHLYTTAPTDEQGGVEVDGGGYSSQPTTITQSLSDANIADNPDAIIFTNMPDCTVTAIGIKDLGGDLIYYDTLSSPKPFASGEIATVPARALSVTITT